MGGAAAATGSAACLLTPSPLVARCAAMRRLQNLDTQRTQAVKALVEKAARAILVTGTPALSRHWELYPQASLI